jgi:hypothetical protein
MKALVELFSREPYRGLAQGEYVTVYAHPEGISVKDNLVHRKSPYLGGDVSYEDVMTLVAEIMPPGDFATLDITVGGKEFALSTAAILHPTPQDKTSMFVVTERQRLTQAGSAAFVSTISIPAP